AAGHGSAVLIRAIEPLEGLEAMTANRRGVGGYAATNGPAKLCQALQITKHLNGHDLRQVPVQLVVKLPLPQTEIVQTTRIGISQAKDVPWRFYIRGSQYVYKV